jgi:purine-binding chemotaxis protein CheW
MAGDEIFAADMLPVKEIIRVPEVVHVPLAPSALEGLANLRGKILPIISLRRLFGFEELAHDDSTRALVVTCAFLFCLLCSLVQHAAFWYSGTESRF